jgi:hypothetical protein
MNFGEALEKCKAGARISRSGWNGKNQFVYYQPGSIVSVEKIRNEPLLAWAREQSLSEIELWGHFDFKPANNKIQCGWLASQSDMQADDWQVVAQDAPEKARAAMDKPDKHSIMIKLALPEANINGLRFNKQEVCAVFEKQGDDDWWQSKDILFLSARNTTDDNSEDRLTDYLNDDRIKQQIANALDVQFISVTVGLPEEPQGIKKYHGVECGYWLADCYSSSATHFCYVTSYGPAHDHLASAVAGCAPAFRIANIF